MGFVNIGRGLVAQKDLWIKDQRPCQGHPLGFTAGKAPSLGFGKGAHIH